MSEFASIALENTSLRVNVHKNASGAATLSGQNNMDCAITGAAGATVVLRFSPPTGYVVSAWYRNVEDMTESAPAREGTKFAENFPGPTYVTGA